MHWIDSSGLGEVQLDLSSVVQDVALNSMNIRVSKEMLADQQESLQWDDEVEVHFKVKNENTSLQASYKDVTPIVSKKQTS